MANEPRDHHVVPQFFLRNFAVDAARTTITTVAKHGDRAVWGERPIRGLGYERDFYVHTVRGAPVSVETDIARSIETPISQSDTWTKIAAGRSDALDPSDRPILYALIRHLEARTPHYEATGRELAEMAADPATPMPFSDEERAMYAAQNARPGLAKAIFNTMAATRFAEREYAGSMIMVLRSPIRLRTSTTPAITLSAPPHPNMALPLPGMVPFQRALTLNPTTLALLVVGDFDGAFSNHAVTLDVARALNRSFVGHFAHFPHVRHLVTDRDDRLIPDMTWALYDVIEDMPRKLVFKRRQ